MTGNFNCSVYINTFLGTIYHNNIPVTVYCQLKKYLFKYFFADNKSMEDNAESFWNRVKQLIKSQNTTQEWLCKSCGIPLSSLRNNISLNRFLGVVATVRIAQSLNTTVEYLVIGVEPKIDKNKIAKEALQNIVNQL